MECGRCGFDVPAGNRFCPRCGTPVSGLPAPAPVSERPARRCAQCGAEVTESQKFCEGCGTAIVSEASAPVPVRGPEMTPAPVLADEPPLSPNAATPQAEGRPGSSLGLILLVVGGLAVLLVGGYAAYRYLANRTAVSTVVQTVSETPSAPAETPSGVPAEPPEAPAPPSSPEPPQPPAARGTPTAPPSPPAAPPTPRTEAPPPPPVTSAQPAAQSRAEETRRESNEVLRPEAAPVVARPATPQVSAPAAPPAKPAYGGPDAGALSWSGQLEKEGLVTIDGARASTGSLRGELPGVPVMVEVSPTDVGVAESPGPQNGWKRLVLRSRVRRQSVVTITWRVLR